MALTVTHAYEATGADDPEAEINRAEWNDDHVITGDYLRKATVTLSSAAILDLHNTPVQLVAAPGAGKAIHPWRVVFHYRYGTAQYEADTPGNEPKVNIAPQETIEYDLLGRDADADDWSSRAAGELYENTALTAIITGDGYYINGDGTLPITVWYTVEDLP